MNHLEVTGLVKRFGASIGAGAIKALHSGTGLR